MHGAPERNFLACRDRRECDAAQQQFTGQDGPHRVEVFYLELVDALSPRDPDQVRRAHEDEAGSVTQRECGRRDRGGRTEDHEDKDGDCHLEQKIRWGRRFAEVERCRGGTPNSQTDHRVQDNGDGEGYHESYSRLIRRGESRPRCGSLPESVFRRMPGRMICAG